MEGLSLSELLVGNQKSRAGRVVPGLSLAIMCRFIYNVTSILNMC